MRTPIFENLWLGERSLVFKKEDGYFVSMRRECIVSLEMLDYPGDVGGQHSLHVYIYTLHKDTVRLKLSSADASKFDSVREQLLAWMDGGEK